MGSEKKVKINKENFVKKLKKHKEEALEYVYDEYIPYVKAIVDKVLIKFEDKGLIEECINDVFLIVWNKCDKFNGDKDDFKRWICTISKFKAIDYYRSYTKKSVEVLERIEICEKNTLEEEIIISENKKEVVELLNELDEVDRKIFVMKYFLGLKSDEIGEKLNFSKSSVDNRLYRGRIKLKKKKMEIYKEVAR